MSWTDEGRANLASDGRVCYSCTSLRNLEGSSFVAILEVARVGSEVAMASKYPQHRPDVRDEHKTTGSPAAPVAFGQLTHSTLYPETRKKILQLHKPLSPAKFASFYRRDEPFATAPASPVFMPDSPTYYVSVDSSTTTTWKTGSYPHIYP